MNTGSLKYLIKQGIVNVWLNRLMSLASIGVLTACFILVGGAALVSVNLSELFTTIEQQNEMEVFIQDDASQATIDKLGEDIRALDGVADVTFISKEQVLEETVASMGSEGDLLAGLEEDNPMPNTYRVTLNDLDKLPDVIASCEQMQGVESTLAATQVAETLSGIRNAVVIVGAIIIGILLLTSLVVIGNTIRLTVFARRREINIMKYVGATNAFIRLPFVTEGILLGLIAAVLAFLVLWLVYSSVTQFFVGSVIPWVTLMRNSIIPFRELWYWLLGGFAICGVLVGAVGSASAVRKHLKV